MSLFGKLIYANIVNGLNMADFYYPLKFLRRRIGQPLDHPAHIWPSTIECWQALVNKQIVAGPRVCKAQEAAAGALLFTDASTQGMGGILVTGDRIHVTARSWSSRERRLHINILEAAALAFSLSSFVQKLETVETLKIRVDNTSLLANIQRNKCPPRSFIFAQRIRDIQESPHWGKVVECDYIASAKNPADWLSRLPVGFNPQQLHSRKTHTRGLNEVKLSEDQGVS